MLGDALLGENEPDRSKCLWAAVPFTFNGIVSLCTIGSFAILCVLCARLLPVIDNVYQAEQQIDALFHVVTHACASNPAISALCNGTLTDLLI